MKKHAHLYSAIVYLVLPLFAAQTTLGVARAKADDSAEDETEEEVTVSEPQLRLLNGDLVTGTRVHRELSPAEAKAASLAGSFEFGGKSPFKFEKERYHRTAAIYGKIYKDCVAGFGTVTRMINNSTAAITLVDLLGKDGQPSGVECMRRKKSQENPTIECSADPSSGNYCVSLSELAGAQVSLPDLSDETGEDEVSVEYAYLDRTKDRDALQRPYKDEKSDNDDSDSKKKSRKRKSHRVTFLSKSARDAILETQREEANQIKLKESKILLAKVCTTDCVKSESDIEEKLKEIEDLMADVLPDEEMKKMEAAKKAELEREGKLRLIKDIHNASSLEELEELEGQLATLAENGCSGTAEDGTDADTIIDHYEHLAVRHNQLSAPASTPAAADPLQAIMGAPQSSSQPASNDLVRAQAGVQQSKAILARGLQTMKDSRGGYCVKPDTARQLVFRASMFDLGFCAQVGQLGNAQAASVALNCTLQVKQSLLNQRMQVCQTNQLPATDGMSKESCDAVNSALTTVDTVAAQQIQLAQQVTNGQNAAGTALPSQTGVNPNRTALDVILEQQKRNIQSLPGIESKHLLPQL